ncbi:MAG: phosphatidylinositol-specific phospholipase C1-like protein [Pseudohongiellaceae bacterium]
MPNHPHHKSLFTTLFAAAALLGFTLSTTVHADDHCENTSVEGACAIDTSALTMNDIQAVGSHNSYKLAIPEVELELIRSYREQSAMSLDYSHLTLTNQLELGMRQIELDIVYDPEGGRFADPLLPRQTALTYGALPYDATQMHDPGFKVLHSQDIDVRSNCMTWIACLEEIKAWSDANPEHVPLLIMFNAKEGGSAYPGVTPALDFTARAYRALDAETLSVFPPERIIKPDDVRGSAVTLREAVLAGGWPALDDARGKVFFALDEGPEKVRTYMGGHSSLEGLPMFVNSVDENKDHAAYFTINSPIRDQERIRAAVKAGFMVRTRADANTMEARQNDTTRRAAAFSSGAQYVSTDYYVPRPEFSDYTVSLPGESPARCNPVRRDEQCRPGSP